MSREKSRIGLAQRHGLARGNRSVWNYLALPQDRGIGYASRYLNTREFVLNT
jgi:hypothetical protein